MLCALYIPLYDKHTHSQKATKKKHENRRKVNSYLFKQQNPVNYEMVQLVQKHEN